MRNGTKRKLSLAIFGLIFICFFLPFANVSCEGHRVATLTGMQLVTGATIKQPELPSMFGEKSQAEAEKVEREPLAILALLSAVVGLGLSFLKGRTSLIASAITGVVGLIFLLLLKTKLSNDILREGQGVLHLEYGIGFWLTFLLFISAALWNSLLFLQRSEVQVDVSGRSSGPVSGELDFIFCSSCGARNPITNKYCSKCGAKLLERR